MASIPQTMKALLIQKDKTVQLEDIPVPTLDINEVLIKVHSVAQNPTDWKHTGFAPLGNIIGCDFSGTVVKLGSDSITKFKIGDTVAGFVHGGTYKDRGAFAQYVKAESDLVWKFPSSLLSFEQAATMGCALWTSIQAFYNRMKLDEPSEPRVEKDEWILIYGGSSSLGLFSVQLAKLSGYKVVTTVSPKNFDLLKTLGADTVIDYKSSDLVEQIRKATGNSVRFAFDTISNAATQATCVKSLAPVPEGHDKGKVMIVLLPDPDAQALRTDVIVQPTLIYTALGRAFGDFPASAHDREHMVAWLPKLEQLVTTGSLQPNPVKLWPGGLASVNDGFEYMRDGKVSAEKIVYNI
ncbi:unnamed protein product [Rhizoctonia solani]|uniref:Enoyl reductase (ER) domain-containing protein n=1 Tax=Rhizoctonia solani TaxID=456999 RepID=A0A8H3AGG7_9AGAM|nr:unnamed protein product [Rhizoctonia solani]